MKYTETHEWVLENDGIATVGISSHAQKELGEVVYVELPEVGREVEEGDEIAVLESTKAAVDIYSPVSGTVTAINTSLREDCGAVNRDPEGHGWLFEITL